MLLAVIGAQWGDEGKGKIVDFLAKDFDYVVRFNGGNNAGHTVVVNGHKHPLSLVPSGVWRKKRLFISQGVVIDPVVLLKEIKECNPDLIIDYRVHIVMPYHKLLDSATEEYKGKKKTGSLKLGIGYCYEDKNNRFGIRVEDLISRKKLKERVDQVFELQKRRIEKVFRTKFNLDKDKIIAEYSHYGKKLARYVGDVSRIISSDLFIKDILFEGAHGTFLDPVFGTYPYTVAVHTLSGSIFPYVGIPPSKIDVLGVVKAYTTRVGGGPHETELKNTIGEHMLLRGREIATVSKRKRRCGWLDLNMIKEAHRLNGFSYLAITKLDVLSGLKKLKILVGKKYAELNGWGEDISSVKKYHQLPRNCRFYLKFIEENARISIKYISVGPERRQLVII